MIAACQHHKPFLGLAWVSANRVCTETQGNVFRCELAVSHDTTMHWIESWQMPSADARQKLRLFCSLEKSWELWGPRGSTFALWKGSCSAVGSITCTMAVSRPECPSHYSPEMSMNTSHRKMTRSSDKMQRAIPRKWFAVFKYSIS